MNSPSELVVIEDDDDEVEIVDVTCGAYGGGPSLTGEGSVCNELGAASGSVPKKLSYAKTKTAFPVELNGYTKPSYNYCRLITQALATTPERKATALEICDIIAKNHPYYEQLTLIVNWKGSIYNALRTRKKFFTVAGTDDTNKIIWSFNPKFEQFMLDKWVPKYVQKKSLSSSIKTSIPWLPKTGHPQQVVGSSANLSTVTASSTSLSPKITFSGSMIPQVPNPSFSSVDLYDDSFANPGTSEGLEKDPLEPEVCLVDPTPRITSVSSVDTGFELWEPEVTVSEDLPDDTQQPTILSSALQGKKQNTEKSEICCERDTCNTDFSLDNLQVRHKILKEEIIYRVNFSKEHTKIEKFRLHCTICDDHLGTSGTVCRLKARLHSTLGVLVCVKCYDARCNFTYPACMWCAKGDNLCTVCSICANRLCKVCVERNFGRSWWPSVKGVRNWECFQCDSQQIWPHRAIAYFLFRHYREMTRKKDEMRRNNKITLDEPKFFTADLSTCCKSVAAKGVQKSVPLTVSSPDPLTSMVSMAAPKYVPPKVIANHTLRNPTSTVPAITSVPSQPMFVFGDQQPSYIYVQTPCSVPSVTLNTGTQYIHNVYPDRNYVAADPPLENRHLPYVNTSTAFHTQPSVTNTVLHSRPSAGTPRHSSETVSIAPENSLPPPYPFPNSPPPPYFAIDNEVTLIPNNNVKKPVSNTTVETNTDLKASKAMEKNIPNITVTAISEITSNEAEDPDKTSDTNPPDVLKIQEEKVISMPILSARESIEKRPMPKSKKQSLLRTVLMNESIESMKRHLQLHSEPNISADKNEISVPKDSHEARNEGGQNIEEPILKSIIESATERLLSLQRSQNLALNIGNTREETRSVELSDNFIDLCGSESTPTQLECKIDDPPITIPKIKIKNLKELQDPEVFSGQESHALTNGGINKESDVIKHCHTNENQEMNNTIVTDEAEVNITDLKQGIIEASRTLINTQKQFKDLAKTISSNLIYKPDQAVELITKFHDILNTCHQELYQIDNNVKKQFGHLVLSTDIDSVLQSMNKSKEGNNPKAGPFILKKRKKQKRSRFSANKKSLCSTPLQITGRNIDGSIENLESNKTDTVPDSTETDKNNIESPVKRKRDLLDFNPLGKKIILGTPEITEEDLRHIPDTWESSSQGGLNQYSNESSHNEVYMEELRRRQYLARKGAWKKKNIWLTSRRKKRRYTKQSQYITNRPLMYSEDGSLMKKRRCKRRRTMYDSEEDGDETYRPTQHYAIRPRRSVSSDRSRPLRLSARMHPSTVAHVAQFMSFEERDFSHLIKPCSVVLDRLDPQLVQFLERRVAVLSATGMDLSNTNYIN